MTSRTDAALETRAALLDAGLEVAEQHGLSGMSINRVVAAAGVAKGTFYVHFADRDAFLSALHQRFHGRVGAAVAAARDGLPPGRARLQRSFEAYFEACLRDSGVRALLLEARNSPGVAAEVAERNAGFAALAEPDLRAMGWAEPRTATRLVLAMGAELAMTEMANGERDDLGRRVLWELLERLDKAGPPDPEAQAQAEPAA